MKKIISLFLAMWLAGMRFCNVFASENDILDEILKQQALYQEIYEERVNEIEGDGIPGYVAQPIKTQVTCYIEKGKPTCTGSYKMDGIVAAAREHVGKVAQVYNVAPDGGIGEFIGYFEVADTGYGAPTGYGNSFYKGRSSAGTIELGITVDFRKPNITTAKQFMADTYTGHGSTGSQVYIIMQDGEG